MSDRKQVVFSHEMVRVLYDSIDWVGVSLEQELLARKLGQSHVTGNFCIAMLVAGFASLRNHVDDHDLIGMTLAILRHFRKHPLEFQNASDMIDSANARERETS